MVVRLIYSSRKAPSLMWAIIFFYGAAATGRCVLGFSLYKKKKTNKNKNRILLIKAAIHYKLVKFARSKTKSYPGALWSIDQSTPDN